MVGASTVLSCSDRGQQCQGGPCWVSDRGQHCVDRGQHCQDGLYWVVG